MWFSSRKDNGEHYTNLLQSRYYHYVWLVMILACDRSLEVCRCKRFHGEWSHRHVDGQTPLAASLRWKVEQEGKGWQFIRVRRWSRSSAWSRDGQWGSPLALAGDCRPLLLRGNLQGGRGFHRCPGHGTLSLNLRWRRATVCTAEVERSFISTREHRII